MSGSQRPSAERLSLLGAFVAAALRYWLAVYPRVARELRRWRRSAAQIPDPEARRLALEALDNRSNIEGAAAVATFVPRRKRRAAVRALVAFQTVYNYADLLAEQPNPDPVEEARRAHLALLAALETPDATASVEAGPDGRENPFVAGLISACRQALSQLPSYQLVAPGARRCAERIIAFQSLSLGSEGELERWARAAAETRGGLAELEWWEVAAAAGSSLAAYALIAAAASPTLQESEVARLEAAYFPTIGALHSLLDSLVDRVEDAAAGELSLVARYTRPQDAADGFERIARSALRQARALLAWRANTLLTVAMACSYLAEAPRHEPGEVRERVIAVLGPLARPTLLVFRLRRLFVHRRSHRPQESVAVDAAPAALDAEPRGADARAA